MRLAFLTLLSFCIVGCSQSRVAISDISAQPDRWRGQKITVKGVIAYEFENLGVYASYEDYCAHRNAIYVEWDEDGGISRQDNRRMAVVAGELDHAVGTNDEIISTGKPGPGPLNRPKIVRWLSQPLPRCPTG